MGPHLSTHRCSSGLALVLAIGAWMTPAGANDSTASLDAGGLQLTINPAIRVESEELDLNRAQVRVARRLLPVLRQIKGADRKGV